MKKAFCIILILHFLAKLDLVYGSVTSSEKGTTAASFLKLGTGARAAAMGNAYTAVMGDSNSLYFNPAALVSANSSLSLTHAPYLDSTFFDSGTFSVELFQHATLGLGFQYFSAGSVSQFDDAANPIAELHPYDLSLSIGYAHEFAPLSIGINVKSIKSKLVQSATSQAVDLGILSRGYWNRKLRFGCAALNLGQAMKFENESAPLPSEFKVGTALEPIGSWTFSLDGGFPRDNQPYIAFGNEVRFGIGTQATLAARFGFNSSTLSDVSGWSGVNVGLGISLARWNVDYAFVPLGTIGLTHRISLGVRFR